MLDDLRTEVQESFKKRDATVDIQIRTELEKWNKEKARAKLNKPAINQTVSERFETLELNVREAVLS